MQSFAALKLFAPIRSFPLISVSFLFSGEDRFSFLEECRDALFEIGGADANALVDRLEFKRGGEVGLQAGPQAGFDLCERDGGSVRQSLSQGVDRRVEFGRRYDAIDHAHLECLLSRDWIAYSHQLERLVVS